MLIWQRILEHRTDRLIALGLAILTLAMLLPGLGGPGVTWDEAAPNIPAAKNQAAWIANLFTLDAPFSKETIDRYWETTSDHPSLPRTLAAISLLVFDPLVDELVAMRIPSALWFTALVVILFVFLRVHLSRWGALAGALSLLLMPRIFGHAHLYSLDLPIMVMWCVAAISGYAVLRGWVHPVVFGVMYAVAFTTKLHAVFLPAPLLAWAIWMMLCERENVRVYGTRLAWAVGSALVLLPVIYIGLQPWLWHDTATRFVERFFDYSRKASTNPIPLYYFGSVYGTDTPWHYPLVMLGVTIPAVLLGLFGAGCGVAAWLAGAAMRWRERLDDRAMLACFLLLCMMAPLMLVLLPLAQAYDGVRLFLPTFPFVACLMGMGADWVITRLSKAIPKQVVLSVLFAAMVLPSVYTYAWLHPHYLAYYNSLLGGVKGAHSLGMESTYWCDSITRTFLDAVNEAAPPNAMLRPHSMQFAAIEYYRESGWLREDIQVALGPPFDAHVMQARQGMFRAQEWTLYLRRNPIVVVEVDGVVLAALYGPIDDESRAR